MDSFGVYLKEISKFPLLTGSQEIELFRSISAAAQLQEQIEPLTKEQRRIVKRGAAAKTRMINSNLKLVVHIAKRYVHVIKNLDMLDIVQEGTLGLIRATESFNGALGYKFSTYAYWWIRQSIQRGIDTRERTIRVPVHIAELMGRLRKLKHQLGIELGRKPTKQELADGLGITVEKLDETLVKATTTVSLDKRTMHGEGDTTLGDMLLDADRMFDTELDQLGSEESHEYVMQCIDMLDNRNKFVLLHRMQIEGYEFKTFKDMAQELGVCRERVKQIYMQSLHKLRVTLRLHEHFAQFEFGDMSGGALDDLGV